MTPLARQLADALHAEISGSIDAGSWECACGVTGTQVDEPTAALALWHHRQEVHA